MSYEVRLAHSAAAYLRRLDRPTQARIIARLDLLAEEPYAHSKPLVNVEGRRSARVSRWRILFLIDEAARVVAVSDIGPRGEVYRGL